MPRYESENLIRYVVTLGASEARVRLDFELAGEHYIATRVARRSPKGVVATKEARLERVTGPDTTEVLAGFEREMSAAVVRLLGLRFDDFTRCVALPQGDFARFLRAKGDERRDLLLRLLNLGVYTEVGATARRQAAEARSRIGLLDTQLGELAFATPQARAAAQARLAAVEGLAAQVRAAQPVLVDLAAREATARGRAGEAREWAAKLDAVTVPEAVREFSDEHRRAQAILAGEEATLKERSDLRAAAAGQRALLPDAGPLIAARAGHESLAGCVRTIAETEARLEQQEADEARTLAELEAAAVAVREAGLAREAVHRRHLAHALSDALAIGEPCPVCDQTVEALPARAPLPALAEAEREVTAAETTRRERQQAHDAAAKARAGTAGKLETLRSQQDALRVQLDSHSDVVALDTLIGGVDAAEAALRQARGEELAALTRLEQAKKALADLEGAARNTRNEFSASTRHRRRARPPARRPGGRPRRLGGARRLGRRPGPDPAPGRHRRRHRGRGTRQGPGRNAGGPPRGLRPPRESPSPPPSTRSASFPRWP